MTSFPDEKMIRAAAREIAALDGDNLTLLESDPETYADDLKCYDDYAGSILAAALTDYRTRTGIDVADVIAKLSAGPDENSAFGELQSAIVNLSHALEAGPSWFTKGEAGAREHIRANLHRASKALNLLMIRVAQEKVD